MKESHSFLVYSNQKLVFEVSLSSHFTVADLNTEVAKQLNHKHLPSERFVCLESISGEEVLDYSLTVPSNKLGIYKEIEKLTPVYSEQIDTSQMISLADFRFKKCLGQGASARVFLVRYLANGKLYALKQIQKAYFTEFKRMEQILRQKKIMSQFQSSYPFLVKLYASFESPEHLNFLLEFYPGGQMFYHLQKSTLSEEHARVYFAELILTFEELHRNKIVYRDLKPENIMIDFEGHTHLTDFGLCRINVEQDDLTTSYCGSLEYMAPEVKKNQGYNYSVDFYTLGAFLYEMIFGVPPYYNKQPLQFNPDTCPDLKLLIKGLIEQNILNRISCFQKIKQNPWLSTIDWKKILNKQYEMPFKINVHETYIHEEFKLIPLPKLWKNHEKFDHLFSFFDSVKISDRNLHELQQRSNKAMMIEKMSDNLKRKASKSKVMSKNTSSQKYRNKPCSNKSKSKDSKSQETKKNNLDLEKNIYLKKTSETNRYQSPRKSSFIFNKLKGHKSSQKVKWM